jgi:hypothetical protein
MRRYAEAGLRTILAYIDAGTGSMLVQVVIATLVAVPFFLRSHIARGARAVRGLFGRGKERSTEGR